MPLVVGATGTSTPLQATSLDGLVTAKVRTTYAGVLLTAQVGSVPDTQLVGFFRLDPDGEERPVRSGQYAPVSKGLAVAYDAEAPLGVPVSYAAWLYSGPRRTRVSNRATVTVPAPEQPWQVWVKPVGRPGLPLLIDARSIGTVERPDRSVVLQVDGREDDVVLYRRRNGRRIPLEVRTGDVAAGRRFERLLREPGPYLLQGCSGIDLEQTYAHIGRASEDMTMRNATLPDRVWSLDLTEIARPAPGNASLRRPGRSYRDLGSRTYRSMTGTYRSGLLA